MMLVNHKYTRQQWLVLLGACLFQCAMIGVLVNCSGVLFSQIRTELGYSMSKISAYNTIKGLCGAVGATFITALFFRSDKRKFLFINQILLLTSFVMLVVNISNTVWYASACLCGLCTCISSVAVPSLLNQWFPKNAGAVTGTAMAFSGLGGAICNPLCAQLIARFGWRISILVLGAVMLLLSVPGIILMFHSDPPANEPEVNSKKSSSKGAMDRDTISTFFLVCVLLLTGSVGVQFAMNISIYSQSIGYPLAVGATLATMVMFGNVAGKFLYGFLCDILGAWKATTYILICIALAAVCFIVAQKSLWILYIAALLFGFSYSISMIGLSRCGVAAYGNQQYKKYIGLHTCVNSIVMAAASMSFGVLFDITNSIVPMLSTILAVACMSCVAALVLSRKNKNGTKEVTCQ